MDHLIVYAPNVGSGGGLVLLRELLGANWPTRRVTAILDRRGQSELGELAPTIDVHWVASSLGGRLRAERLVSGTARSGHTVLCFHNLPPVFPTRGRVLCYVQNAYLVRSIQGAHLSRSRRFRIAVARFIARRFRRRVHRYLVQTPTMAAALRAWHGPNAPPIDVLPFAPKNLVRAGSEPAARGAERAARWDFIYVSDGSAHKNHRRLFAAWRLLAERGSRPSLALTLHPERDVALREEVRALAVEGLLIEDLGQLPHATVMEAYRRSGALIFPSYAESFGNPLVEAEAIGLPILAPELDYVRDVCEPTATFDPYSPRSIARAVLRFVGEAPDRVRLLTGDDFAAALGKLEAGDKS